MAEKVRTLVETERSIEALKLDHENSKLGCRTFILLCAVGGFILWLFAEADAIGDRIREFGKSKNNDFDD